jgi:group I intron endonuclease
MYFIYITSNLINGKRYVGLCSMKKKNWENYLGSGKILIKAIKKYGVESFSRKIFSYHENLEDAIAEERKYILENNCHLSEQWYNIAVGFTTDGFKGKSHTDEHKQHMSELYKGIPRKQSMKNKMSKTRLEKSSKGLYSFDYLKTEERREISKKVGLSNKGRVHPKKHCKHCDKNFGPGPFAKFHGDNCKLFRIYS